MAIYPSVAPNAGSWILAEFGFDSNRKQIYLHQSVTLAGSQWKQGLPHWNIDPNGVVTYTWGKTVYRSYFGSRGVLKLNPFPVADSETLRKKSLGLIQPKHHFLNVSNLSPSGLFSLPFMNDGGIGQYFQTTYVGDLNGNGGFTYHPDFFSTRYRVTDSLVHSFGNKLMVVVQVGELDDVSPGYNPEFKIHVSVCENK
jgi:hypothetical protein